MSVATVEPVESSPTPLVRRVPTRSWEPPYDDELPPRPVVEGSLALAHPALEPPARRGLHLVPDRDDASEDEGFGPRRTARAALPDPRPWTHQLVQAIVEILAVQRPAAQLAPWASPAVYRSVERRVSHTARSGERPAQRPVVRSVHVSEPDYSVVEACAVVDTGARRRALALRLEGIDGRWQCTALQLC